LTGTRERRYTCLVSKAERYGSEGRIDMARIISAERTSANAASEKPIRERQMAAYRKALEFIEGRRLLEIGCGEGIGTSILAGTAASVLAIDYSDEALGFAREKYGADNIEFRKMRVPPMDIPDASIEAVVCFQMIEHLEEPEELVSEIGRALRADGVCLLATVNKEETISENPYHLREFTASEMLALLESHFEAVEMYGVFGDELFMRYWTSNRRWANNFMRLDVFNLADRLPPGIKQWLFDAASTLMRARLKSAAPDVCENITYENFLFKQGEYDGCLDFFAVCRKPRR
jgi:2-polyprenyl-3-methyl-5-hydroxy-6-metoxy-1,4-benzoquinol methylase